jgi:uncharacterized protein
LDRTARTRRRAAFRRRQTCRSSALAALLLLAASPFAASSAWAETLLHFTESATLSAEPDELVASLHAEAAAQTAQEAQSRVNAMIAAAVAQARGTQGVAIATGGYQVWQSGPPHPVWQASQVLRLRSHDGTALLALVGALQAKGLGTDQLAWQLSDELARRTRDAATKQALSGLRARAEGAADVIGMRFDSFREIRLDASQPGPVMQRGLMAAAAAPAPIAMSENVTVTATVEAAAVLQPRQ